MSTAMYQRFLLGFFILQLVVAPLSVSHHQATAHSISATPSFVDLIHHDHSAEVSGSKCDDLHCIIDFTNHPGTPLKLTTSSPSSGSLIRGQWLDISQCQATHRSRAPPRFT